MEKIHIRALEALEPFIHQAQSANSALHATEIIKNATSAPNTFVFAELLEVPAIQALRSPDTPQEYRNHLRLLEIFAWGTWKEYQSTPNLPPLDDKQAEKLLLLTLLTLATAHNPLTYAIAMKSLSLPNHAALESLVTQAIYSSLITARISPATNPRVIHVTSTAPLRDVHPQSIPIMISVLKEWRGRCSDVIGNIEAEIARIKSEAEKRRAREKIRASRVERSVAGWDGEDGGGTSGGTGGSGTGAGAGAGAGSKHSLPFSGGGRVPGLRPQFSGTSSSGASGNKRDLNDFDDDGRYPGHGDMEVDGAGADADEGFDGIGESTRQSKRLLALGSR
ncbi:hypothetical protein PABG_03058 [Paracoccidioides brasiliensis Pb03]|uniref:Uncharacterized protein n=1 Tax=Paracoccidioides brasiliensis TaxID=121759 RepID=A0A1D2JMK5_PARBR|nr:hypothetical protein PABG_03058 [Paracoccidioides brasiliensis Pb03]ODH43348.1 hypothetical protein ACO22_01068 [Paracoccidioides brasiliensis]ODH50232.1 hypothetical protein GX48_03654 [Paracoccidioides brasiliensis]